MVMEEAVDGEMSLSNMVLGFMEDFERDHQRRLENDDDDDEGSSGGDTAESKAFWQTQHSQLHEALAKTSPAESRIRADTEEAVKSMRAAAACSCTGRGRPAARDCRLCMLRHVADRLRDAGYNSALCKSKWTRSPDIPSGTRLFLSRFSDSGHHLRRTSTSTLSDLRNYNTYVSCSTSQKSEPDTFDAEQVGSFVRSFCFTSLFGHRPLHADVFNFRNVRRRAQLRGGGGADEERQGGARGGGAQLPRRVRGGARQRRVPRAGDRAAGGVRGAGRPPARRRQGHVRRGQAVHEGEQHAHGALEEAQVHAGEVARHARADGAGGRGGDARGGSVGDGRRLAGEADQVQGVHAHLRLWPERGGGRVMEYRYILPSCISSSTSI
ncbi:uncharacterized protein LOC8075566 isoform X1 [Sorghum bicolor]|uniref:uncharacterized protein LOC8075566 isoform X1 n=1 Tax=Sorghum bicolor TaxID=4558 RepID=UPI000B42470A|nr:uncharacterized protein LOC8075566 isoform X1 [Sorghum bicolor]|eukprot:XP_021313519.1 uncharacterized protein LOC8075566 isoform X1 [Sorghum bicolor]